MNETKDLNLFVLTLLLVLVGGFASPVDATFSIVAVDLETGEVGGAGASCVPDVTIINDLLPGIGAIHTQAAYLDANQNRARTRMLLGETPQQIMDWLAQNDARQRPGSRQYGAVTLAGGGPSASFTGNQNGAWAGHRTGPTYAIQGNILSGPEVVDDMETAYLAAEGLPLEERLMAAMQAAKRPGADIRCFPDSSQSAFLRVARPDTTTRFWLDIRAGRGNEDPINNLQVVFDTWKQAKAGKLDTYRSTVRVEYNTLPADGKSITRILVTPRDRAYNKIRNIERVTALNLGLGNLAPPVALRGRHRGRFLFTLEAPDQESTDEVRIYFDDGRGWFQLKPPPVIHFTSMSRY